MEARRRFDPFKVAADTTTAELTKRVVALLLPLLLTLVSALVPQVRDRILPVLPKPLLAVLIGTSLSVNLALFFYSLYLRKQRQRTQAKLVEAHAESARLQDLIDNPPKVFKSGVWWDNEGVAYCPADKVTPLGEEFSAEHARLTFYCHTHKHHIAPRDDGGKLLTPAEAKQRFLAITTGKRSDNQSPKEIDQPSAEVATNEKLEQTLRILRSYRNNLSNRELDTSDVDEYHSRLDTAQSELQRDLNDFRIPPSAIKAREIEQSVSIDPWGGVQGDPYRIERYIPADIFKTYLDALIDFLDQDRA